MGERFAHVLNGGVEPVPDRGVLASSHEAFPSRLVARVKDRASERRSDRLIARQTLHPARPPHPSIEERLRPSGSAFPKSSQLVRGPIQQRSKR